MQKMLFIARQMKKRLMSFFNLAFLERAAAGLNLDALSIDLKNKIAKYLVGAARKQVAALVKKVV